MSWPLPRVVLAVILVIQQVCKSTAVEHHQNVGRECVCERRLKPVCSNEGRTYENACLLECSRRLRPALSVQYTGSCCPSSALCPQHYAPVCDNYGSIHDNQCHFEYQKCLARKMYGVMLRLNTTADCAINENENGDDSAPRNSTYLEAAKPCNFECPLEAEPLCDSKGVTHKNLCFFEKFLCNAHLKKLLLVTIAHKGQCEGANETTKISPKLPKITQPIFGTVIHEIQSEKLPEIAQSDDYSRLYHHQADPFIAIDPYDTLVPATTRQQQVNMTSKVTIAPTTIMFPTSTYQSPSLVPASLKVTTTLQYGLVDSESTKPNRTQADSDKQNSLGDTLPCSAVECYKKWKPVCDDKNQTHRNECLFRFRVCKLRKEGVREGLPVIVHKGQCNEKSNSSHPSLLPTVLPSTKLSKTDVQPFREGFCRVCNLLEEHQKVCTNMNGTFANACDLAIWNCERRAHGLEEQILVHVGACRNNSLVFSIQNEVCPSVCPRHYKPVCDSEGTTFPNLCTFQMINCHERKTKKFDTSWLVTLRECPQPDALNTNNAHQTVDLSLTPLLTLPISSTLTTPQQTQKFKLNETAEDFMCPEAKCSEIENPVCDQEGTLHKNECYFTRARCLAAKAGRSLHTVSDDECPANKCRIINSHPCPTDYDPVCTTDFRTLPNTCTFERAKCQDQELDVLFKGECQQCLKRPCPILDKNVADDSLFLCDQNGETKSKCEFEMVRCIYEIKFGYNITAAYEGKCCSAFETCSADSQPLCDHKGREHRNHCYFNIANCRAQKIERQEPLQIVKNETCVPPMVTLHGQDTTKLMTEHKNAICNQPLPPCSDIYDPVCGSDQQTYPNECQFLTHVCNITSKPLHMLYKGACCRDECADEPTPVCDNESHTHLNLCKFDYQRCLASRVHDKNLTIVSYTTCPDDACNLRCPQVYQPVCAKNGKTYVNECELKKLNCFAEKQNANVKPLEVNYPHECCSHTDCPLVFEPVCDETKQVYPNLCEFQHQQCVRERKFGGVRVELLRNVSACFETIRERYAAPVIHANRLRMFY